MARVTGTVRRSDLEGGFFTVVTDDGQSYTLEGGDAGLRQDGLRVEIDGVVAKNRMTLGMQGPVLTVASYRRLG